MEFPKTLLEFEKRFPTDEACRAYLETVRWPEGFKCPQCGKNKAWRTKRGTYFCSHCKRQSTVTAGTVFHRTKIPMTVWFRAMWLMIGEKSGINALGLKRQMGLKRYETTWRLLQKLRLAAVRPERQPLSGEIEVDETVIGGDKIPRGLSKQRAMVIIATEIKADGIGRIRMQEIPTRTSDAIEDFIVKNIQTGSTLFTDGYRGYSQVISRGYVHKPIPGYSVHPDKLMPRVHRVASLLKRWLMGTYHGKVGKIHLNHYLDEFVFRFNRRQSESRGKLFQRLIEHSLLTPTTTYRRD
jgi:predicted RNA-binding Zn-ribbon protein involved in translation (DUF1610 family)/transposase-like protein